MATIARFTSRARPGVRGARDLPERVIRLHTIGRIGRDRRGHADPMPCDVLADAVWPVRPAPRQPARAGHAQAPAAPPRERQSRSARRRTPRRPGGRSEDRRVEQDRVLAQQAAARPVRLDEQRHERLGDRLRRRDLEDVLAVGAAHHAEREISEEGGLVEPVASEDVRPRPATPASADRSSSAADTRSMSASNGWLSAECRWISPRPSAYSAFGDIMALNRRIRRTADFIGAPGNCARLPAWSTCRTGRFTSTAAN